MKKLLGFLFFLSICLGTLQAQETTLAIYSTNDVHGHLTNFAKIARYIKKDRINYTHTLVLSGGDVFTGNPIVDQYPQRGLPMIDLMNQTGYQYAVFGNHEFDYGLEALTNCIKKAHFELICANVKTNNSSFSQPKPYVIFRKGEIRICILGLVETTKQFQGKPIPSAHPDRLKGLSFTPPFEAALTYKHLRQECDLFIGLFHTGYDTDKKIAQAMPELDVIIGGHTHTRIPSTRLVNGVLVTQAEDDLKYIGKTTLTFQGNQVTGKKFELIKVEDLTEEDSVIKQSIQRYSDEMPLKKVLAKASAQFNGKHPLGALMTDAIVNIQQTDFAFQNSGGIRIGMLPKGDITLEDVYRLDPFGNSIIVYEMTPEEIRTLLKNSYRKGDKSVDLIPAGLQYTIYTHHNKVTRIKVTDSTGQTLDENKRYRVGMNSYIASSYQFDKSLPHQEMPIKAVDGLIKYLNQQQVILPHNQQRGIIVEE